MADGRPATVVLATARNAEHRWRAACMSAFEVRRRSYDVIGTPPLCREVRIPKFSVHVCRRILTKDPRSRRIRVVRYFGFAVSARPECILLQSSHRLKTRILKYPKIHECLRILNRSILNSNYHIHRRRVPTNSSFRKTALNFWIKNVVMSTIQYSLTRQQFDLHDHEQSFTKSTNRLLPCSFSLPSVGVLNCPRFPFNSCVNVIDCREMFFCLLCEFEYFAVTSDVIKRILRILKSS